MAAIVGGLLAFPVNRWLVANGLKHGMGTVRAIGHGGGSMDLERDATARHMKAAEHSECEGSLQTSGVSAARIAIVSALTLLMLTSGAIIAFLLRRP